MTAYYNEHDPFAAAWLRNLISAGYIAPGDVDERSIADVRPDDVKGYTQAHFFAGIGGWSIAARYAGWPDERPLWTGSCPCTPFSLAGKQQGEKDPRHLWPDFFRLIAACAPTVIMGEQVAAAVGQQWFDQVCDDLEGIGYAVGAAIIPACAVGAPHLRERLYFISDANRQPLGRPAEPRPQHRVWPPEPDVARVAHGVPNHRHIVRAFGNAIVPAQAAEVISAYLEAA